MIVVFLVSLGVGAVAGNVACLWWLDRRFKRQHGGDMKPFPYRTAGEQYRNPYEW